MTSLPRLAALTLALLVAPACGSDAKTDTTTTTTTTTPSTTTPTTTQPAATTTAVSPFTLASSPEHVNRIIPGHRPVALVQVAGGAGGEIGLSGTTTLAGAQVSFTPSSVPIDGVAEVWMSVPDVKEEVPMTITVTGSRGTLTQSLTIDATAVPGVDDLQPMALDIVDVFLKELAGKVEGLPADRSALTGGTPVAGLLVVTHYAWFTADYEIGLAWHIMVAPDDWAEIYLRPRSALAPTKAYRLSSWSTALGGGAVTIDEIPAPAEVTR